MLGGVCVKQAILLQTPSCSLGTGTAIARHAGAINWRLHWRGGWEGEKRVTSK